MDAQTLYQALVDVIEQKGLTINNEADAMLGDACRVIYKDEENQ